MLLVAQPLDGKFRRAMIRVVLGVLPVDEVDGEALRVAVHGLGNALAQAQEVVGLLVLVRGPRRPEALQRLHRVLDGVLREQPALALEFKSGVVADVIDEHRFKNRVAQPPPAQFDALFRRQIFPAHLH
jgi:hypothetical protein